ncbi:MAG: hypothetical protein EHM72_12000, partial [Calditrichaeota bacterium]
MKKILLLCTVLANTLGGGISLYAQSSSIDTTMHRNAQGKRIYTTVRLQSQPPQIDGKLNDSCWQNEGTWSGNYLQQIP